MYNPNAGGIEFIKIFLEQMADDVRIVSISKIGIDVVPDENY